VVFRPSGALNGFVIKPDGYLYGPQGALGTVIRVDLASGSHTVLAEGFKDPTAVKSDSAGNLYVSELATGRLYRLDSGTWTRTLVAQLSPGNDNIAISSNGLIYVSNFAHNSIEEVNPRSGAVRSVVRGRVSVPGGLAMRVIDGREWLYVADLFTTRRIDAATGEAEIIEKKMGLTTSLYPSSATITGNHLVLSSWTRNEVVVQDLTTLETVRSFGGLKLPHDATEMRDGTFVVAEMGAGRVVQLASDGKPIRVLVENMEAPLGIALAAEHRIYVSDARAGTLSSIDLQTGERQVLAKGFVQPEGIAVDSEGRILVLDAGSRALLRVEPGTGRKEILLTDLPVGLQGPPPMHPSWVHNDVVIGRDGAIYFGSDAQPALYRLTPSRPQ
jgi:sugar lactone lactonase YvrE